MKTWIWIAIAVVAVVVIGLIVVAAMRKRRTEKLRDRFGPEYDRTVDRADGRRDAERDLEERHERRQQLDIRPLAPAARERYAGQWAEAQQRFVDDPPGAIAEADRLVTSVMGERGYPMDDFESRAGDISVDHPELVENYRAAHRISESSGRQGVSTEDQRQAMVHFRGLFEELLGDDAPGASESRGGSGAEEGSSRFQRNAGEPAGARRG
jgi:FtsZ-interacting cell division protein ZipA